MKSQASRSASPKEDTPKKEVRTQSNSFPIVAIGASAGGLDAYTEFFHTLPADTGMAFVLIQHLDPNHQSMLTEIIAKATEMPVEEVKSGVKIRPNHVYVIPPNALMAISECVFRLSPRGKGPSQHLAVNFFMRSLAQEQKSRTIGIILSGTGADGTVGMEEIKAEGGITFAQEPATARYDGMPRSAIDSGCVDFILSPKDIAKELRRIQQHPYVLAQELAKTEQGKELTDSVTPPSHQKDFTTILDQLRKASGVDFSQYKPNTIHRRALRRMVILKQDSLGEYAKHLKEHPEEAGKLFDDVLIPVTSFFRDFEAFEALKAQVYPAIVKDKGNKGSIRMWAPGCSTGEETYSLAMTLLEFLGDKAASFQVQIFGTDLNEKGIQHARAGVYRESIAEEISPERMSRFFVKVEEGYRVNKAVRDMCVFARQNLANDPPFSQMNIVACRNLLIYIQPVLQKKIIPILHYALKPSGFLVLGGSESVSAFPDLFSIVDKKHKIYGKKAVTSRLHYDFAQSYYPAYPAGSPQFSNKTPKPQGPVKDELDVQAEADRVVLKNHAPVGVVINSAMEVIQFRGRTTPYLEPAPGKPSLNVLKLARNGLAIELRTLIGAAVKKGTSVQKNSVPFDGNGHPRILNLSVCPLGKSAAEGGGGDPPFFLVLFEDVTPLWIPDPGTAPRQKMKDSAESKQESKRLKQELSSAQDALRTAIELEDGLKEEFQSANEEILSANEELQSTNEELETSKEELQSANEEMNTLNTELRHKNTELQELGNDISNLLNSTRIPVVMLDRRLCIRRYTPTAAKLLKVVASDIGRPVGDIKFNIEAPGPERLGLESLLMQVLETLQPLERDVRDLEGHWYSLSILPYRTLDNKIDGVVLALQDIDAIKSASEQMEKSAEFLRSVLDTVREPLLVLDADLKIVAANDSFLHTFKVSAEHTVDKFFYSLGHEQWNIPALRTLLELVLPKSQVVKDFVVEHDFENLGLRTMVLNAQSLSQPAKRQPMILLAIEDVTEHKRAEEALQESEERLRTTIDALPSAIYTTDSQGHITHFNPASVALSGRIPELGKDEWCVTWKLFHLDGTPMPHDECPMAVALKEDRDVACEELIAERPDGTRIWAEVYPTRLRDAEGRTTGGVNMILDITERKQAEVQLRESEERFRTLFELGPVAVYYCDALGVIQNFNHRAAEMWGRTPKHGDTDECFCGSFKMFRPDGSFMPHEYCPMAEVVNGTIPEARDQEVQIERPDGSRITVIVNIRPLKNQHGEVIGAINCFYDISERKFAQVALIKSEKLAAAGRLAATLAHEINNPLQAVTNLVSLWRQSPGLDTQGQEYAAMAEEELGRVVHLTQQSLGFYRESIFPKAVNVEEIVNSVLSLYMKQITVKEITVVRQFQSDGVAINGYPGEIRQVLSTLVVNAMEATSAGGSIEIFVRKSYRWNSPATRGVRITVTDTGIGIPARNIISIFEPFFTTKGEQGTGLGLWVSNGILNRLGGSIHMRSSEDSANHGTCFSVFIPSLMVK